MDSYSQPGTKCVYELPEWCKGLKHIPKSRVKLAQLPTPIHKWVLPGVADGFEVYIKRDDLTGSDLSGNKVRKLEFVFAEVLEKGYDCIITVGSYQSNHCRATAVAARQLGLESHLLLNGPADTKPESVPTSGNILLNRLVCANMYIAGFPEELKDDKLFEGRIRQMTAIQTKLRAQGKNPYLLQIGGANATGCWGYIEAFNEMIKQGILDNIDDIVVCVGSSGTASGLAAANYLTGSKIKLHGIAISMRSERIYPKIDDDLSDLGLTDNDGQCINSRDLIEIVDRYVGEGYGKYTAEDLALLKEISTTTGIILDTTFTLKTVKGMLCEMKTNPTRFKGHRILFIHTGGLFGNFDGKLDKTLLSTEETNRVQKLNDFVDL